MNICIFVAHSYFLHPLPRAIVHTLYRVYFDFLACFDLFGTSNILLNVFWILLFVRQPHQWTIHIHRTRDKQSKSLKTYWNKRGHPSNIKGQQHNLHNLSCGNTYKRYQNAKSFYFLHVWKLYLSSPLSAEQQNFPPCQHSDLSTQPYSPSISLIPLHQNLIPPYFPTLILSIQTLFIPESAMFTLSQSSRYLKKKTFQKSKPTPWLLFLLLHLLLYMCGFSEEYHFFPNGVDRIFCSLCCKLFCWWFSTILSGWVWKRWHKME